MFLIERVQYAYLKTAFIKILIERKKSKTNFVFSFQISNRFFLVFKKVRKQASKTNIPGVKPSYSFCLCCRPARLFFF